MVCNIHGLAIVKLPEPRQACVHCWVFDSWDQFSADKNDSLLLPTAALSLGSEETELSSHYRTLPVCKVHGRGACYVIRTSVINVTDSARPTLDKKKS